MEMEICNRTVTCNVLHLSVSGYNEEGQKLCKSSREKKKRGRREERVEKIGLHRQREEEEKRRMEKTKGEGKKKDGTSKKRELIKGNLPDVLRTLV